MQRHMQRERATRMMVLETTGLYCWEVEIERKTWRASRFPLGKAVATMSPPSGSEQDCSSPQHRMTVSECSMWH